MSTTNKYLLKIAEETIEDFKEVSKAVGDTVYQKLLEREFQEHTQGSVPGTAFKGKETTEEEIAEIKEVSTDAGKEVANTFGPRLSEKIASLVEKKAETIYSNSTSSNFSSPSVNVGSVAGGMGLMGAGMYGRSLMSRARAINKRNDTMLKIPSNLQRVKEVAYTDVSNGISKVRSMGSVLRGRFPLRA